MMMMIACWYVQ